MSVNVDAVNERLNGLVTLLKAVGVDSLDTGGKGIDRSSKNLRKGGGLPDARQLDDDQIEAIIKKLQMAQSEAPQIIAALEAHAEQRSRGSQEHKSRSSGSGSSNGREGREQRRAGRRSYEEEQYHHEEEEEEDDDDDDSDEDPDAQYPMVGEGCSDEISVVSDLTTPTVVSHQHVPEEEHYRDTLPPMIVGGGGAKPMMIQPTKRKNLVGAVGRGGQPAVVRPGQLKGQLQPPGNRNRNQGTRGAGGAAASRRKNYNATMEKLAHEPQQGFGSRKLLKPPPSAPKKKSSSAMIPPPTQRSPQRSSRPARRASTAGSGSGSGWGYDSTPSQQTMIDPDGFLTASEGFDPFSSSGTGNGFSSGERSMRSERPGNYGGGHHLSSSAGGGGAAARRKKKAEAQSAAFNAFNESTSGFSMNSRGSKQGKRKSRRASLT
jgi:hypothetical protein